MATVALLSFWGPFMPDREDPREERPAVKAALERARRAWPAHGTLKTTDGEGRATFAVPRAGRWLLRATDVRRSTKPEADWESDFATVTFEVP